MTDHTLLNSFWFIVACFAYGCGYREAQLRERAMSKRRTPTEDQP